MEVVINDGKRDVMIRGTEKEFELCERSSEEAPWRGVAWYSDLANALTAVAKRKIRNSDARTLQELKEVIETVRREILAVWSVNDIGKAA